jgi:ribosomal-protein-alanine N-acetyltransferase
MQKLMRKTKRLLLRPLEIGDYQAWVDANSTLPAARNIWDRGSKPLSDLSLVKFRKVLRAQKQARKSDTFHDLVAIERSSGKIIGTLSIMGVQRGLAQSAYIGYSIYNLYWGKGFGKEAVSALIEIAFRQASLHRVEAGIEPTNRRSILLARSLGLRKEGLKKRAVFLRGTWVDLVMYSATCEEFGVKWKGAVESRLR